MKYNNNFHFLRWFFASMVVFAHISVLVPQKYYQSYYSIFSSHFAITGFFVISGFLVSESLSRSSNLKIYYFKRVKRIFPAYYLVLIFFSVLLVFFSTLDYRQYFLNVAFFKYLFWNGLFLNFFSPNLPDVFINNPIHAVNGSLWTLKLELGFYTILPILMHFLKRMSEREQVLFLGSIYSVSILYRFVFSDLLNEPALARQLPAFMSYFSVGIWFHLFFIKIIKLLPRLILPSIAILWVEYYVFEVEVLKPLCWGNIILYCAYYLPRIEWLPRKDDYSYGIYLCHFPIIQIFVDLKWHNELSPILGGLAIYLMVLLYAVILWHVVEKRFVTIRR